MDTPNFGSLDDAKAAATASGYKVVYDDRYNSTPPLNVTGAVSLKEWPGISGKNGEAYEFWFDGGYIHARPAISSSDVNVDPKNTLEFLRRVIEIRKAIGPEIPFLVG